MLLEDPILHPLMTLPTAAELTPQLPGDVPNLHYSAGWRDHVVLGHGRAVSLPSLDPLWNTENDGHNIVLALCIDAFVPWPDRTSYSITPIMLQVLNLPENIRHKFQNCILYGVVPGPHKPKTLQPYLALLVDELLELHSAGVQYINPVTQNLAVARVKLLFTSADYPGHGEIRSQQCQGATFGCMTCELQVSECAHIVRAIHGLCAHCKDLCAFAQNVCSFAHNLCVILRFRESTAQI